MFILKLLFWIILFVVIGIGISWATVLIDWIFGAHDDVSPYNKAKKNLK